MITAFSTVIVVGVVLTAFASLYVVARCVLCCVRL